MQFDKIRIIQFSHKPSKGKSVPECCHDLQLCLTFIFRERYKNARGKSLKKSKDWILEKKERRRRQGK